MDRARTPPPPVPVGTNKGPGNHGGRLMGLGGRRHRYLRSSYPDDASFPSTTEHV
jgi:hypothetical protein